MVEQFGSSSFGQCDVLRRKLEALLSVPHEVRFHHCPLGRVANAFSVSQRVAPGAQHTKNLRCGAQVGRGVEHLESKILENCTLALEDVSNSRIDRQEPQVRTESDPSPCEVPL